MTAKDLEAVAQAMSGNPTFDGSDRKLVTTIYKTLADGRSTSIDGLAESLGRSNGDVRAAVDRCNVEYDGEEIVGFGGLSLVPTAHGFNVRGRRLYTWCVWDPLFIAPILGEDALVESTCPITGEKVGFVAGVDGPRRVTPESAVLTMRVPDDACRTDIVSNFCSVVLLFASEDAARAWTRDRPGTFVITLDEAFALGQIVIEQRSG